MDTFNTPLPQEAVGNYIKRLRLELKMSGAGEAPPPVRIS